MCWIATQNLESEGGLGGGPFKGAGGEGGGAPKKKKWASPPSPPPFISAFKILFADKRLTDLEKRSIYEYIWYFMLLLCSRDILFVIRTWIW